MEVFSRTVKPTMWNYYTWVKASVSATTNSIIITYYKKYDPHSNFPFRTKAVNIHKKTLMEMNRKPLNKYKLTIFDKFR